MTRGLEVERLGVRGGRGWVFRDVSFAAEPGTLVAASGPSGSGRTSLLLTLAGRMRPSAGTVTVDGRRVSRSSVSLGLVPGVNDFDDGLTPDEHARERVTLVRPQARRASRLFAETLAELDPDVDAPALSGALVRDIGPADRVVIGLVLALLEEPRIVVADEVDTALSPQERERVWKALRRATSARTNPVVVVTCLDADPPADVHVPLGLGTPTGAGAPTAVGGPAEGSHAGGLYP